jgi:hypothetical protein
MAITLSKSRFKETLDCMTNLYYTGKKMTMLIQILMTSFWKHLLKVDFKLANWQSDFFAKIQIWTILLSTP